ncbi:hypothetical protein M9Y10_021120 [Tritrichomonas musculus]|uniref:t-SNARE coiled-coil homology domain-containing protein n=1 Tax=Tritrichomonas musculus TaxID=1915356 RepID=A0ABR2HE58_9EUKA
MSLQNYDPTKPKKIIFTYDSLHNQIVGLKKQCDKTKSFADELDVIKTLEDCKKNARLQKTYEDCKKKYVMYKEAYDNFKKDEPPNQLQPDIEANLQGSKRIIDSLAKSLAQLNQRAKIRQEELNKEAAEKQAQELEQAKKSLAQRQEEQMSADLEHTAKEMSEIAEQMNEINSVTHQVDDKLTEDHAKVVHIDETISEAKEEMIAGNKDLEDAEEDQKAGSIIKTPKMPCCTIC